MTKITTSEGQSLLDVALWLLGGTDALFALADANGLAITDTLVAGQVLVVPEGFTVSAELVSYYQTKKLRVNTANTPPPVATAQEGLVDFADEDFLPEDFY
jgi:hypothetical protein